jgi:hypothetical protein
MRTRRVGLVALAALGVIAGRAADASAGTITCIRNAAPLVDDLAIDGRLDDWDGVKPTRVGGTSRDASFDARCLFDDTHVAIALDVRDDAVIRVRSGKASEDTIEVSLGAGKPLAFALLPGAATGGPRRTLGGKALPSWALVEDSLQQAGFSLELRVPWAKIPGYDKAAVSVPAQLSFRDADQATGAHAAPLSITGGLIIDGAVDVYAEFLRAVGASKGDVALDQTVDLDPARAGKERVVVARTSGGAAVGVLTDAFAYMTLPIEAAADLRAVQLIDWRGDGSAVLAATLRQHGGGGSRDLLALIGASGAAPTPLHSVEIRKEHSGNVLASTWKLVKTGKGKAARTELQVTAGPATGWTAETFDEEPATDATPIAMPWSAERYGAALWLSGASVGARALPKPADRKK